jgi:hypothetical protein
MRPEIDTAFTRHWQFFCLSASSAYTYEPFYRS